MSSEHVVHIILYEIACTQSASIIPYDLPVFV